jgi:hypothetical protein
MACFNDTAWRVATFHGGSQPSGSKGGGMVNRHSRNWKRQTRALLDWAAKNPKAVLFLAHLLWVVINLLVSPETTAISELFDILLDRFSE